ncbi:MAG: delta-60 repeat domain-containing protein, partial [Actinomycetota bacterium]|nr:delta-60 repeat domain-containing protein [Actinomycetota bacterium]MDA3014256.1 delta-60 repeat domain-containing protein [Actinomycetota bacterium]
MRRTSRFTLVVALLASSLSLAGPSAQATSGDLDTTFSDDGFTSVDFNALFDDARAIAIQPDGKVIIGGKVTPFSGSQFGLARLTTSGDLDTTFSGDGKKSGTLGGTYNDLYDIALQSDGKIVAVGAKYFSNLNDAVWLIARYTADGDLDTTFSGDGIQTLDFSPYSGERAQAVAIQSDGKIVVGGQFKDGSNPSFALARFTSSGELDMTFSADGIQTQDFNNGQDGIYDLAIQDDGKIVAAGLAQIAGDWDVGIARYTPNGNLDTTFSDDGVLTSDFGSFEKANSVALQPDGKIVVLGETVPSGSTESNLLVARYSSTGVLDTSFSGDGKFVSDLGGDNVYGMSMVIQPDGKIVGVGSSQVTTTPTTTRCFVARLTESGELDTTFSTDGIVVASPLAKDNERCSTVAMQSDGALLAAGTSYTNTPEADFVVMRILNAVGPSALSYTPSTVSLPINVAVSPLIPTVTGTVTSWSVSPALPTGLTLDPSTGVISGTPTTATASATYTITATNGAGTDTYDITIEVFGPPTAVTYTSNSLSLAANQAMTALTPTVTGTVTS